MFFLVFVVHAPDTPNLLCAEGSLHPTFLPCGSGSDLQPSTPCSDYLQLEKEEGLRSCGEMLWAIPREDGPELSVLE